MAKSVTYKLFNRGAGFYLLCQPSVLKAMPKKQVEAVVSEKVGQPLTLIVVNTMPVDATSGMRNYVLQNTADYEKELEKRRAKNSKAKS